MGYASLFVAILGIGGVYTCIFVITGIVFPKQNVGSALLLVVVISVSASFYAPIIVLYKAPIPFLVLTCMMAAAFASSVFLPKESPDNIVLDKKDISATTEPDKAN